MREELAIEGGVPVRDTKQKPWPAWPIYDETEEKALLEVMHSGKWWYVEGTHGPAIEQEFAQFHDAQYGVACTNGSAALEIALRALGVGCGGPMTTRSGSVGITVSPLNIPQWRAFPLEDRLADWSGAPTFVDNDAKALALGEGWIGAAVGNRNYLAIVVSTGVGGGIVLDGRLLDGEAANAGHIGHMIVDPLGRSCPCGARGCLEAHISGTAIASATGRPAAQATVEERMVAGRLLGRAVASACNLLDLRLAVVAGSVALGFGAVFFDAANDELARCARLEFARGARVVPAGRGADGPIVGAAAVGLRGLGLPQVPA